MQESKVYRTYFTKFLNVVLGTDDVSVGKERTKISMCLFSNADVGSKNVARKALIETRNSLCHPVNEF